MWVYYTILIIMYLIYNKYIWEKFSKENRENKNSVKED